MSIPAGIELIDPVECADDPEPNIQSCATCRESYEEKDLVYCEPCDNFFDADCFERHLRSSKNCRVGNRVY